MASKVGVYVGNTPAAITSFETWFGKPVDQILGYTGEADWSDYETSVPWAMGLWSPLNRPVFWSVPLLASGGTLAQAAAGTYNSHYRSVAQNLSTFRAADPVLYIRTGWEFNGDWMKWAALGKEADFIGAFQQFVTTFRSVSSRFRFEWNVNLGNVGMNPETAYPGDAYVDVIGMDVYYNTEFDGTDASAAFDFMVAEQYGLQWHQDFAAAHSKPTAFSEWGVMTNTSGPFIVKMRTWIESHNMLYHNYWDSYDGSYAGKLSDGHNPATGAVYIEEFAGTADTGNPTTPTDPTATLPYSPRTAFDLTINLGLTTTRTFQGTSYTGKHIKVVPKVAIDTDRGLIFDSAASVTIIGGHFRPTSRGLWPDNSLSGGTLNFFNCGAVYLEGVLVDNINTGNVDAINCSGITANTTCTIQNCRFDNVQGLETDVHGDILQTGSNNMGKTGPVRIHQVTGNGTYQGFFLDPQNSGTRGGGIASVSLSNVNLKRNGTTTNRLYYFYGTATRYDTDGYPITLSNCWANPGSGQTVEHDAVWPADTAGSANEFPTAKYRAVRGTDTVGVYASWPGLTDTGKALTGKIYQGDPPAGDFVPVDKVGLGYVQGTVLAQPANPQQPAGATDYVNLLRVGGATWTSSGSGTVTVDPATGKITLAATGTDTLAVRQGVPTTVNKRYQLTWSNDTAVLVNRQIGSTEGGSNIVTPGTGVTGDNKVEFTATTTVTWISFLRSTAGTATVSSVILQEIPAGAASARRLNGLNQYFSLDAQAKLLRLSNANWFIGGFVAFTYIPAAGVYLMDFGRTDPGSTAGGAGRVRLFYDPDATKIAVSTSQLAGTNYRENYIIKPLQLDTWYYVGLIAKANADVQVVLGTERGASYIGTVIPSVDTSGICRLLQLGARAISPRTNFTPARYSNWIWASNWIPSDAQINALAGGVAPQDLAGFTAPTGANLYHWPMSVASGDEPSIRDTATLVSNSLYASPVTVPGPILQGASVGAPSTAPLDIIIV
jgi:hypothetical protein